MRLLILFILLFPGLIGAEGIAAGLSNEPLPVFQANPAMIRFLDPRPASAAVLEAGQSRWSLNQSYTSIFLADQLPNPNLYIADMEFYVAEPGYQRGLGHDTQLGLFVPVMRPLAGKLDGFLHNYHRMLGLPNGGRESRPNNQFSYGFNGTDGWQGRARWELGNARLQLKHRLTEPDTSMQVSAEVELQLPTSSHGRGWSHGGVDASLGGVASWQGDAAFWHFGGWWVHPFKRHDAGGSVRDYARFSLTAGYRVNWLEMPLNLMLQAQGGSSPYQTGIPALDSAPWLVSFGFRTVTESGQQWSFAFVENISQKSTQDFGINIGVSM